LAETLAGNKCEILTITSRQNQENMSKRKGVIITARVHPGESVGSWMMKGALDFLVDQDSIEAEYLR
jgi:cytosolic carboxypeptidase protein 2/3